MSDVNVPTLFSKNDKQKTFSLDWMSDAMLKGLHHVYSNSQSKRVQGKALEFAKELKRRRYKLSDGQWKKGGNA